MSEKTTKILILILNLVVILNLVTLNTKIQAATNPVSFTKFELDPTDDLTDNKATINIELTALNTNFNRVSITLIMASSTTVTFDLIPPVLANSSQFVNNKLQISQTIPTLYEGINVVSCVLEVDGVYYICSDINVPMIEFTKVSPQIPVYRFFNKNLGTHLYTSNIDEKSDLQMKNEYTKVWSYEGSKYFVFKDTTSHPTAAPVYRFFNTKEGGHVYTTSEEEKTSIINNLPKYSFEGVKYYVETSPAAGFLPVYRFFNIKTGTHLYTINEGEKATIMSTLPQYSFEGAKFYVLEN